jgi:hypothetical protein
MLRRIRLKPLLSRDDSIDFPRSDRAFFHNSVRDHRGNSPVEKVQNPVVDSLKADAEFVNAIAQEIRFRPPQFVPHLAQPLQAQKTLVLDLLGQAAEPL